MDPNNTSTDEFTTEYDTELGNYKFCNLYYTKEKKTCCFLY